MPDSNFNVRVDIGRYVYSALAEGFIEDVVDQRTFTVSLGEANGRGDLREEWITYPSEANISEPFNIYVEWWNYGDVSDTIFCRIVDKDTGDYLFEQYDVIGVDEGRSKTVQLIMPNRNWNIRMECGHNDGEDVVDDFIDITINAIGLSPNFGEITMALIAVGGLFYSLNM